MSITALVTGGTGAIGRAVASTLATRGASVAVASRSLAKAREVVDGLKRVDETVKHVAVECDVTDPDSVKKAVGETVAILGSLQCVANASGIVKDSLLLKARPTDLKEVVDTNLLGAMYVTQECGRVMARQREGSIIHIGSVVGLDGNVGQMGYAASKAGLLGVIKTAAKELGRFDIRVNLVVPGFIDGGMVAHVPEETRERVKEITALRRLGTPEDVAQLVAFLAEPKNNYITGQTFRVDGGLQL